MTENKQPYFNGNCAWKGTENQNGLHVEDFLKDLKGLFDKHGIENIQASSDDEIYAFQMGYVKDKFGLNGSFIRLK